MSDMCTPAVDGWERGLLDEVSQDELWRQTRREQSRINRWLAWAVQRRKRRDAARAAKRAHGEKAETREKS